MPGPAVGAERAPHGWEGKKNDRKKHSTRKECTYDHPDEEAVTQWPVRTG